MRWAVVAVAVTLTGCSTQDTSNPPVEPASSFWHTVTTTSVQVRDLAPLPAPAAPTTTSVPAWTPSTVPPVLPGGLCPEWAEDAVSVGWPVDEIETVDYLMYRESRCDPSVINTDDPRGGSRGLLQINGHWCRPNPSYGIDVGWLQESGVLDECDDLYDPDVNLKAALVIWLEYGYGPWGL